jgi:hypothetical protein
MFRARSLGLTSALLLPLLASAFTLGGGGDARALDKSQKFDLAAPASALADTYVATQAEGKLRGLKRIAITNMCVQFINDKQAWGNASGATRVYSQSASAGMPLNLVKMQAVADAWLDQMEADLKAAGYELLPYEQLTGNDLFKGFAAKYDQGIREGTREGNNNQKGVTGESIVYVSPKGRPFATDCGTISPASTGTFVRMSYPLDAEFLTVAGVVDLGEAKSSGGLLRGARAAVDYAQHIRAGDSQFQFVGKMGPGARVWLKQSIVPQRDPFTLGASSTSHGGSYDIASQRTTLSTSTNQQVQFDEALYYDNALKHLVAMHRMFIQKMSAK